MFVVAVGESFHSNRAYDLPELKGQSSLNSV